MSVLSIRQIEEQDIPSVLDIINQDYMNFFDDQQPLTESTLSRWIQLNEYTQLVGVINNRIVSYLSFLSGRNSYLGIISVHPEFRRQGISRQMISHMFDNLQQEGCVRIHLEIREDNTAMQCAVALLGFVPEGYFRNLMHDGSSTIRYVRFLR